MDYNNIIVKRYVGVCEMNIKFKYWETCGYVAIATYHNNTVHLYEDGLTVGLDGLTDYEKIKVVAELEYQFGNFLDTVYN